MIKRLINLLASVKFAVAIVVIIAAACVTGTLLPQGDEVVQYIRKYPAAAERMHLFGQLGLTHVFYSWWFIGLLITLAATVTTCSTRRFATVRRAKGSTRRHALGSMLTHISILLILTGGVIRGVWGQKGYLGFREGQTARHFFIENKAQPLPFAISLAKFEIETYDNSPDGPVKSFKSTVNLPDGEHTVEVNRPLRYRGYTFYQSGYNPRDLRYTSFQVVKDPGVPVVFTGFGLMIGGLFLVFYLNPWLTVREAAR